MSRRFRLGPLLIIACSATLASAGTTKTFEISTYADLSAGEPKGTMVSSEGEVVVGAQAVALKGFSAPIVCCGVKTAANQVYFATSGEGKLLRVEGSTVKTVADFKTKLVTTLAAGPGNRLYAGLLGAKIVEVDPRTGKWRQIARLPAGQVWALLYSARDKRLYAASGSPGKVFSIPPDGGKPVVYYDAQEAHLLTLAVDGRGNLLTGGKDNAILYRILGKDRAVAVHDFAGNELQRVASDPTRGFTYLIVNQFPPMNSGLPRYVKRSAATLGTALPTIKAKTPSVRPEELRPGAKTGQGTVYRIDDEGRVEALLSLSPGYFLDLALDERGVVWVAEATKGKLYRISVDRRVFTAADVDERQVMSVVIAGKRRLFATSDGGAIYDLRDTDGPPRYLSKMLDATFPARWGAISLRATAALTVESRHGNTAKADKTWTAWRPARKLAADRFALNGAVTRYAQLRFTWPRRSSAILRSFAAHYRPLNQRAQVKQISFAQEYDKSKQRIPTLKISWTVDNPDKDPLTYQLHYREETGSTWQPIVMPAPLTATTYKWDTTTIPDGYYRIRVVASDSGVNGEKTALPGIEISARQLVDNRPPELVGLSVRKRRVTGVARDALSTIRGIEYSLDGQQWFAVDPDDGVFDSPAERFTFEVPKGVEGTIAVRTYDVAENSTTQVVHVGR
ncbi:MAG: fibronectin type III domain-containing protein [Deltaproteobacteria bacterium]|nr:fibronectin type III domain-containing protein [Deltaproteobacteria bacterium]